MARDDDAGAARAHPDGADAPAPPTAAPPTTMAAPVRRDGAPTRRHLLTAASAGAAAAVAAAVAGSAAPATASDLDHLPRVEPTIANGTNKVVYEAHTTGARLRFVVDPSISFDGVHDPVMLLGWNTGAGGAQFDASKGSIHLSLEHDYWSNQLDGTAEHSSEVHFEFAGPYNANRRRAFSSQFGWRSGLTSTSIHGDRLTFFRGANEAVGKYAQDAWWFTTPNVFVGQTTAAYLALGGIGTNNGWVDARGPADNVDLNLRSKGTGLIRFRAAVALDDGRDLSLGTTVGSRLGTAPTQRLGFYGATPMPRPSGWGAPTGLSTRASFHTGWVNTQGIAMRLKALIDDLTALGLLGP